MKKIILNAILGYAMILGSLVLSGHCFSQIKSYSFEEVDKLIQEEPKNMVVFLHTEWCSYCHMMKESVFTNDNVKNILNKNYYFTPLNAEVEKDIQFAGKTFKFKPNGRNTGTHELAKALGTIDGKLAYPTLVVLNPEKEIIFQYSGYLDATTVKKVLRN